MQVAVKTIRTLGWFLALIVAMSHVAKVVTQSVQIMDHNNYLSLPIVVLVVNLGYKEALQEHQWVLVSETFLLPSWVALIL